jgi:hypothetical protein
MNDPTYVEAARALAQRALLEGGTETDNRLAYAFRLATTRKPSGKETKVLRTLLDQRLVSFRANPPSALQLVSVGESPRSPKLDPVELAAWTTVTSVIFNLDEALNK